MNERQREILEDRRKYLKSKLLIHRTGLALLFLGLVVLFINLFTDMLLLGGFVIAIAGLLFRVGYDKTTEEMTEVEYRLAGDDS